LRIITLNFVRFRAARQVPQWLTPIEIDDHDTKAINMQVDTCGALNLSMNNFGQSLKEIPAQFRNIYLNN
jgi:cell division FtsZ-interacting protein ZapD